MNNNIKEIRLSKNITISEFSRITGVSRTTIYKLEEGKTNPSLDTIVKISKGLMEKPEKIFNLSVNRGLQKGGKINA